MCSWRRWQFSRERERFLAWLCCPDCFLWRHFLCIQSTSLKMWTRMRRCLKGADISLIRIGLTCGPAVSIGGMWNRFWRLARQLRESQWWSQRLLILMLGYTFLPLGHMANVRWSGANLAFWSMQTWTRSRTGQWRTEREWWRWPPNCFRKGRMSYRKSRSIWLSIRCG